jgi:hypothetical protein
MHSLKVPSFFLTKSIVAPQGETLWHMYPFFNNSSNYICNSFNSSVLILYGVFDIGTTLGIKPIKKCVSLFGGKLSISSNTSTYPLNTRNSSRLRIVHLVGSSTIVTYNWKPLLKHHFNYENEISPMEIVLAIPSIVLSFHSSSRQLKVLLWKSRIE